MHQHLQHQVATLAAMREDKPVDTLDTVATQATNLAPQHHRVAGEQPQGHAPVARMWAQHRNLLHQPEPSAARRRQALPAAATHNAPQVCSHKSKTTPPARRNGAQHKGRRFTYRRMPR